MRITRLRLTDVRRHRDLDLELAPGVTVVRGPNEAGKTTIQRALELALARKVTSTNADLDGLRPWGADPEARPVVSIEFVQEDLEATHHGSLEKAFRGQRGTVRLEIDGEVTTDPAKADEQIADLTGIPTEPFFRSTASIRHHEMDGLARDEAALRDRLQASISGADRGTSAAKKKLEKALKDLQAKGERNPGRLKIAEELVARTAASVEQDDRALALLERDRDALAAARERRLAADGALAEGRSMLDKARQAERFVVDRDAARERFERYREAVATSEEIDRLHTTHPSSHPLPVMRQLLERLRVLDREIGELRASLGDAVDVDFDLKIPEPVWIRWAAFAILMSVGAVAITGLAVSAGQLGRQPIVAGAVLVAIALGLGISVFAVRKRQAAGDFRRAKQLRDDQIARRLRGRSQLESELREKEADFEAQLEGLALPDLAAAEALLAAEEAHVQSIERLQAKLEGSVGRQPAEALTGLRDAAALEIEQKSGALEALGPIAREPRARERLETEVRGHEAALERARDEESNCRARVEANTVDAEAVAGEAERLVVWREQLAGLQRRTRVYDQALAAIEQAERATMRTATRYLEKKMVADLDRITDGRYRRIRVDDRTLDISIFAPERGDWVDVTQLSQGTIDQVYLAARLGLVRLVTGDRRPPLIFDDPFVSFDDDRARRTMALLRDLGSDFQLIFLTCSDRYDEAADRVVVLDGPTTRDDSAPDEPAFADQFLPEDSEAVSTAVSAPVADSAEFAGAVPSEPGAADSTAAARPAGAGAEPEQPSNAERNGQQLPDLGDSSAGDAPQRGREPVLAETGAEQG
ncbi:MAG TPA: AAA family ATPase [Candidatus Saccharimonadales bacterium]|nr:AAA family ATPase [Candidatus Saccharimonadales bacterium]